MRTTPAMIRLESLSARFAMRAMVGVPVHRCQPIRACLERAGNGNPQYMLVLTIDHVPGHRVEAILGEVIGATVLPDNPYVEGVKGLDGAVHDRVDSVVHTRAE